MILPSGLLLLGLVLVPLARVAIVSLQDVRTGAPSGTFIGVENFTWAIGSRGFWNAVTNSLVWTFGSVALEMLLGLGLALLLHQQFRLRGLVRTLVLFPYLMPTIVAVMIWRYMVHDIVGIINHLLLQIGLIQQPLLWLNSTKFAMLSVILVGVWKFFPFVVIALLGILQAIPQAQYEAARIDGANAWQQFLYITFPHILPIFLLSGLLRTIWNIQKFDIIYLLTGGGPLDATTTLPLFIYNVAFVDFNMGRAAAVAILMFFFLLALLAIYRMLLRRAEA